MSEEHHEFCYSNRELLEIMLEKKGNRDFRTEWLDVRKILEEKGYSVQTMSETRVFGIPEKVLISGDNSLHEFERLIKEKSLPYKRIATFTD